ADANDALGGCRDNGLGAFRGKEDRRGIAGAFPGPFPFLLTGGQVIGYDGSLAFFAKLHDAEAVDHDRRCCRVKPRQDAWEVVLAPELFAGSGFQARDGPADTKRNDFSFGYGGRTARPAMNGRIRPAECRHLVLILPDLLPSL